MIDLYAELTSGPLATEIAPFITSGDDAAIATILNRKNITVPGIMQCNDFAGWCAKNGQRRKIEVAAQDLNSPIADIALSLRDLLLSNRPIDFGKTDMQLLAQAWMAAGQMTQSDYDSLISLSETILSRAEQLGISITHIDVAKALRG